MHKRRSERQKQSDIERMDSELLEECRENGYWLDVLMVKIK